MKVNNINTAAAFTRAIRLLDGQANRISKYDDEKMSSIRELQKVLNSRESEIHPDNTAQKIRNFFKEILGDYNGENGIIIRPFGRKIILFSGKEADKLKQLDAQAAYTKDQVDRSCHVKRKRKDLIIQNAKKKVETGALDMLENGGNNKPNSTLEISFKDKFVKNSEFETQQEIEAVSYMSKHHAGGDFAENDFGVPYYNSTEYASIDI